jgi:hypothetical protein
MADHSKKDKANVEFRKLQKAEDGKKAMSEYETEAAAVRAKTARLKALRLARDAAQPPAPPKAAAAKTKKPAAKKKASSATLSKFLDDQKGSGRSS